MDLLVTVQRHLRATGVPPTLFGRRAVNDPRLVGDLCNGRTPRPETRARIETYIAAHADDAYVAPPRGRRR